MFKKILKNKKVLIYMLSGIIIFLSSYFVYTSIINKEKIFIP